jgi:cytidylate kinase
MADLIITIDGPAASGKSTIATRLADRLDAAFLDTGAMYRAVTLAAMQAGVDLSDQEQLMDVLGRHKFEFTVNKGVMIVVIDGVDVTEQIRRPQVTANARYIACAAKVRGSLVEMQREFAAGHQRIVTEGRDQGTVAFPKADIKFYLTAEKIERARRRQSQLPAGGRGDLEQIRQAIAERDKSDQSRGVGPLKPAEDAVVVDSTDLTIEQVVEKLLDCVKTRCLKK